MCLPLLNVRKSKGHKINVFFDLQGDSFKFTQCYLFFPGGTVDLSILRRFDVGKSPILFTSISAIFCMNCPIWQYHLLWLGSFLFQHVFHWEYELTWIYQSNRTSSSCWFTKTSVTYLGSISRGLSAGGHYTLLFPNPSRGKKQNVSPRHRGRRSLQRFTEPRMSPGPQEDERRLREVGRVGPSNKGTLPP